MFCKPGFIFGGDEGVRSRFHVLRSQTHFRWYRGRRVSFLSFALPDSFSALPMASDPVFMFFAPGHVFSLRSFFHVLYSRTRLRRYRGRRVHFPCFAPRTHFRRYRGRRLLFSCFALPDSFSTVPRASGSVFMFCALGLVFGGTEGVQSCFHVFRS
jgi:hypothetical protein